MKKIYNNNIEFKNKECIVCNNSTNFTHLIECEDRRINEKVHIVICKNCGLIFMNPAPTEESYIKFYEKQRDNNIPNKEHLINKKKDLNLLYVKFITDNIFNLSNMDALDVGSGSGDFLYYLKPHVKSLKCTEVSSNALKYIPIYYGCPAYKALRIGDVFPKNNFDLITSVAVIEHYSNPLDHLKDYYNSLKNGGELFICTSNAMKMSFEYCNINSYFKFVHPYYFSINTLASLLKKTGFSNIRYWLSEPTHETRSIRNPSNVMDSLIMLMAKKDDNAVNKTFIIKDKEEDILRIFEKSIIMHKRMRFMRKLAFPLRVFFKYLPLKAMRNKYEYLYRQYNVRNINQID